MLIYQQLSYATVSAIEFFVVDVSTQCHTLPICRYVHVQMAVRPCLYTKMALERRLAYEYWLTWKAALPFQGLHADGPLYVLIF